MVNLLKHLRSGQKCVSYQLGMPSMSGSEDIQCVFKSYHGISGLGFLKVHCDLFSH